MPNIPWEYICYGHTGRKSSHQTSNGSGSVKEVYKVFLVLSGGMSKRMTFQTEINTYKNWKARERGAYKELWYVGRQWVKKSVSTDEAAKRLRSLNFIHTATEIQQAWRF